MKSEKLLIYNAQICLRDSIINGCVLVENGIIKEVTSNIENITYDNEKVNIYDMKGRYLLPGFVDIHCHGGAGSSFMDCNDQDIKNVLSYYLKKGTTTIFPTSVSCDDKEIIEFLESYGGFIKRNNYYIKMLGGCHLEGPYLSEEKAGAQARSKCRSVDLHFAKKVIDKYPHIKRWTIAPEKDEKYRLAYLLKNRNIVISAGHTDVLYKQMKESFDNGYSHITHLYSGMNSLTFIKGMRKAGAVEAALIDPNVTVEIIADGIHLPYPFIELVYKLKGSDKIAIVTDGMRGTGTKGERSILGSRETGQEVILEDGVAKLPDCSSLAGSITPLNEMFRKLIYNTSIPFIDIVRMCSYAPACIMNIQDSVGEIKENHIANFIDMDSQFNVVNVIYDGTILNESAN